MNSKQIKKYLALSFFGIASITQAADNLGYDATYTRLRNNPSEYSWLQERSTEDVNFANMVLCMIKKSGADRPEVINKGPYVVSVQAGSCDKNDSSSSAAQGGQSSVATEYEYGVAKSTYNSSDSTLTLNFWFHPTETELTKVREDNRRTANTTRATVKITLPANEVGFDEVTWVNLPANSTTGLPTSNNLSDAVGYGAMKPVKTANGFLISYVSFYKDYWSPSGSTRWMNLARTGNKGNVSLVGTVQSSEWDNTAQQNVDIPFNLSANDNEFVRAKWDRANQVWGPEICFDRKNIKYNTWNYVLFDEDGNRKYLNANVDVTYTDAATGKSYRGNYSNDNFWMPDNANTLIATAKTANVVVQDQQGNKKDGVITVRDGNLRKVVISKTNLSSLEGIVLNYWDCKTNPNNCASQQIVWNKTSQRFNKATDGVATNNSATSIFPNGDLWVNTNGGITYVIKGVWASNNGVWSVDWTNANNLNNNTIATTRTQRRLTAEETTALQGQTLNCISNCPLFDQASSTIKTYTANKIYTGSESLNISNSNNNQFRNTYGWTYTFDAATGKLFNSGDSNNALVYTGFISGGNSTGSKYAESGALIPSNTLSLQNLSAAAKCSTNQNETNACPWNYEPTEYYVWRTGEMQWNKDWSLTVGGAPLQLDNRLNVTFECPQNREGCTAGAKFVMDYNGPGRLWGVPNKCVDSENYATECTNNTINKQWINKFNLTKSAVDADKTTDKVVGSDGKTYFILPQGSGEYYMPKNTCTARLGSPLPAVAMADIFVASKVDLSASPLDPLKDDVTVRDGEVVKK